MKWHVYIAEVFWRQFKIRLCGEKKSSYASFILEETRSDMNLSENLVFLKIAL